MKKNRQTVVVLHNVRSAHNVGSIFRTADAAGVSKIYLSGYTPSPFDRFGRPEKKIQKTALGAEQFVSYEKLTSALKAIARLKKEGFFIVGVEQSPYSTHYKRLTVKQKIVFIFGNEVRGLPKKILQACDRVAHIPMKGKKESLNVSVAAGVILFHYLSLR